MISLPSGARVWLPCGRADMRKRPALRRQGASMVLAMLAQQVLAEDPSGGALFASRGKRGGLVKLLWYDGQGMCLFSKRLENGHFVWPVTETGRVSLTRRNCRQPHRVADLGRKPVPGIGGEFEC